MSADARLLVATALLMTVLAALAGAGLVLDPRVIDGAPAWLKPLKFAVSVAIYAATLAWMTRFLDAWPRVRTVTARTTALVLVVEVGLIGLQAARGTSSHFNTSSVTDGVIFAVMGVGIMLQTVVAAVFTVALWRQKFEDDALGWAVRLGMAIAVVGALTGGLMTRPTPAQLALAAESGGSIPRAGAHTVGAPDGGPGLPGTGWSTTHGDLRVGHFVGLHAMQALPLVLVVVGRRRGQASRRQLVFGAAALYGGLFALLLAQALAAQSVAAPRGLFLALLGVWAVAVAGFVLRFTRGRADDGAERAVWGAA